MGWNEYRNKKTPVYFNRKDRGRHHDIIMLFENHEVENRYLSVILLDKMSGMEMGFVS